MANNPEDDMEHLRTLLRRIGPHQLEVALSGSVERLPSNSSPAINRPDTPLSVQRPQASAPSQAINPRLPPASQPITRYQTYLRPAQSSQSTPQLETVENPGSLTGPAAYHASHPGIWSTPRFTGNSQPFQGLRSLGSNITQQVNQQRLTSASNTLPRRPQLPQRRPRGRAIQPPTLATSPNISQTHVDGRIRLKVKVYPPQERTQDLFLYQFHRDSFNAVLEAHHLMHILHVVPLLTLVQLIILISEQMQQSPASYQFTAPRFAGVHAEHETLPLRILSLVNRGRPRPSDGLIRLRKMPTQHITIQELAQNSNAYAHAGLCIEDGCFVLHFVVADYPLKGKTSYGSPSLPRWHRCLSRKIYRQFPGYDNDNDYNDETSGGETDTESTSIGQRSISSSSTSSSATTSSSTTASTSSAASTFDIPIDIPTSPTLPPPTPPLSPSMISRHNISHPPRTISRNGSLNSLPPTIWSSTYIWTPPPMQNSGLYSVDDLPRSVFQAASGDSLGNRFMLRGVDVAHLAEALEAKISEALDAKDFTKILASEREFLITDIDSDGREDVRSLGEGIEREVIFTAFQKYTSEGQRWFLPRIDGYSSIATSHSMATARYISDLRKKKLAILGALTGLLLVYGIAPSPLSPVLLHYWIHGCNIHSIHPALLGEWNQEFKHLLDNWLEIGPTGDTSPFQAHFNTFHDIQVALLQERDEAAHMALAGEMLYRAIIGNEPSHHPELQAFLAGFRLPCSNGFQLVNFVLSFQGGSEGLLSLIWTSHIKNYNDLQQSLSCPMPSSILYAPIQAALGGTAPTFPALLADFLKGSGIPCPALFEDLRPHLSGLVASQLHQVEEVSFRSRMFCWAATGSPSIDLSAVTKISVNLVGDDDVSYASSTDRAAMALEGKISFRTCYRQARAPASYLAKLANRRYSPNHEPHSFHDAVHHWLLCETLNAIGYHTMI